jgi:hydrogenase maturation protein HypF
MDSPKSLATLERLSGDLQSLYGVTAEQLVCDAHSGYTTHRWAQQQTGMPVTTVWHHHAHASALVAEGQMSGPSLVFVWDGVGLGQDGTLWGGEAFQGTVGDWQRVASLRPFRLPGGERAGREPWRSAAAMLWECGQTWNECPDSTGLVASAWKQQLNCPTTSAAGRLFDAAAALVLDTHCVSYEAGAPMQLEAACRRRRAPVELPLKKETDGIWRSDWEALLPMLQDGRLRPGIRAETFHSSMAYTLLAQACAVRKDSGIRQVGLCGGVFQNRILTDEVAELLQRDGFDVYLPERLPCNDAALCVGQIAEATVSTLRAAH